MCVQDFVEPVVNANMDTFLRKTIDVQAFLRVSISIKNFYEKTLREENVRQVNEEIAEPATCSLSKNNNKHSSDYY